MTAPKEIYLQCDPNNTFAEQTGITWSEESINKDDTKYILEQFHKAEVKKVRDFDYRVHKAELQELAEYIDQLHRKIDDLEKSIEHHKRTP